MTAKKDIKGAKRNLPLPVGKYELAWRKDEGTWNTIEELEVTIPAGRKATATIKIEGVEEDA